jgi:hypothetical protein
MIRELNNARLPGEKFKTYQARRRTMNAAVKLHCRGRMSFKSCDVVSYPEIGKDLKLDAAIVKDVERGLLVDLVPVTMRDGSIRRVGRVKGTTYRRFPEGQKRPYWREIELMFGKAA